VVGEDRVRDVEQVHPAGQERVVGVRGPRTVAVDAQVTGPVGVGDPDQVVVPVVGVKGDAEQPAFAVSAHPAAQVEERPACHRAVADHPHQAGLLTDEQPAAVVSG
jgi:hypothetical protein